ncbi:MAG: DUF58 domain-containing protein [Opitutales bacterium]
MSTLPAEAPWTAINADWQRQARAEAEKTATLLQLPFRQDVWRGAAGAFAGAGTGSSIDFQDHRPYVPGDDPRYINWQAYARTGHYTMKLYREEVSPLLDLVIDASPSLLVTPEKARRFLELIGFVDACAARAGSLLRLWQVGRGLARELERAVLPGLRLEHETALADDQPTCAPAFDRVEWRPNALRLLVTDLLFPGDPEALLGPITRLSGRTLLFCPWDASEAKPDWEGNLDMRDCESTRQRPHRFNPALLRRYHEAYRQHFSLWEDLCQRRNVLLLRVRSEGTLAEALLEQAHERGAIEFVHGA